MGLMDILNGMQNGPRGQRESAPSGSGGVTLDLQAERATGTPRNAARISRLVKRW